MFYTGLLLNHIGITHINPEEINKGPQLISVRRQMSMSNQYHIYRRSKHEFQTQGQIRGPCINIITLYNK